MRTQYVKALENCATERGRRVRIYGVGNGIHSPKDPFDFEPKMRQDPSSTLDWSTLLLGAVLLFEMAMIYLGLAKDPGFRSGLFYDVKYLRLGVLGFMFATGFTIAIFHFWVVVQAFENWFMRSVSAITCAGTFFVAFHILFLLGGGFAHFQVNAVDLYCSKKYNERECLHARSKIEGLPSPHRRILAKTSSIYGRVKSNASPADMALFSLIKDAPKRTAKAAPSITTTTTKPRW